MRFDLFPHVGAGNIKLGMSRQEIRNILGEPDYSSEKSIFTFNDISLPQPAKDGYFENELQITFDDNSKADFIEFSGRGARHTKVYLNGLEVFRIPAPDLVRRIAETTKNEIDNEDEEIPYSYTFPAIDLAVWRQVLPQKNESEEQISESDDGKYFWTIGIGIKGYYTKQ
jgi:hypothetical protein